MFASVGISTATPCEMRSRRPNGEIGGEEVSLVPPNSGATANLQALRARLWPLADRLSSEGRCWKGAVSASGPKADIANVLTDVFELVCAFDEVVLANALDK